jgi:hypothetical protein
MPSKTAFAILAAMAFSALSSGQALAWGCTAVDSEGAYGYSTNWPDEQDAEMRALDECEARSKTHDCEEQSCDPNG